MSIQLRTMAVEVPGSVVRNYNKDSDTTTMVVTAEQATALYESLGTVCEFFKLQGNTGE